MGNVARVLARDIKRLITTPAAWAVVLFLTILPSLYTWFNVAGFWDPYNNTGNLRVCVVNEDRGAQVEGIGDLDLGSQIIEQLSGNSQLGWAFVTRDEAEEEVRSGKAYAAFVMPADFSSDVASILTGDFQHPEIEYYVNEKIGPVAPKITDTGANALDSTINEAFVSAVSEAIVVIADEKLGEVARAGDEAKSSAQSKVDAAREGIGETRAKLAGFADKAQVAKSEVANAQSSLESADGKIDELSNTLKLVSLLSGNADTSLIRFSTTAGSTIDKAAAQASTMTAQTNAAVAEDANALLASKGSIDGAIARAQATTQENDQVISQLEYLEHSITEIDTADIEKTVTRLKAINESIKRNLTGLERLSNDVADAATTVRGASGAVNNATQQTITSADGFRSTLDTSIIPAIAEALSSISDITADLSAQSASQKAIIEETILALDEIADTLDAASKAVSATDAKLGTIENELEVLSTDIASLGTASALSEFMESNRIDPDTIADFMMSPTKLKTEVLYPLNAYGSAMAPLFINLTLWIGVFMLMVIMRLEVDDEGIEDLTITQRFYARLLFLAPLVCIQAAICCSGCIWLGVQTTVAVAFYATAIIASLAYLAIQYTLSTTLQHIGKAICIILVFVQIPGASGIYPIEMTPAFFQTVYPMFPFTYGINAMRETIGGFYDGQWLSCIGVLAAYLAVFLAIGTVVRPYLTNLNRIFAREIAESDIIIGEGVELPARRWRMSQVINALADRDEYRTVLEQRANRFMRAYPLIKIVSLVVGILVPVSIGLVLGLLGIDKVVILTSWLIWLILIVTFLLIVEFFRDNLSHQLSLEAMDADEVRKLIRSRNRLTRVKPLVQDVTAGDEDDGPRQKQDDPNGDGGAR